MGQAGHDVGDQLRVLTACRVPIAACLSAASEAMNQRSYQAFVPGVRMALAFLKAWYPSWRLFEWKSERETLETHTHTLPMSRNRYSFKPRWQNISPLSTSEE